jgi:hypothetical protein
VYHLEMFAFGISPEGFAGERFRPRAAIVTAPYAVRLGHAFPLPVARMAAPRYEKLGFQGYPPDVVAGETALPETDVVGFGLLLLELLATERLSTARTLTRWTDVIALVEKHSDAFANPSLARMIAKGMSPRGNRSALYRLLERIGGA